MKNLRHRDILEYLQGHKEARISELQSVFHVSHATIHRDLLELENLGRIHRSRGYVSMNPGSPEHDVRSSFQDRLELNCEAKISAARRAVQKIEDGDILFLDSSTTVYYLARELQRNLFTNLTIITNSVLIIKEFSQFPTGYFLVALGGNYDLQLDAFLGASTIADLDRLRIDKAFISALGVTGDGVFSRHENHSYFLHRVLETAAKSYLVLTAEKFDKAGLFRISPLDKLTEIISSEEEIPEAYRLPSADQ